MMPRRYWAAASALALFCVAFAACKKQEPRRAADFGAYPVDVRTVTPQPFRETVVATGTLLARESVALQAERAGLIREIKFEEGKPVRAGDVLLLLDDSELQAQLAQTKAELELARTVEIRDRALTEARTLSQAEYEASRARLEMARAQTELIQAQLAKTRVVAPFDGLVGLRHVSPGAYVVPGTRIASLQDISSLKLDFTLPERYLPFLQMDGKVTFRVAGQPKTFTATVEAIEPAVNIETRSIRLRALVPNQNHQLLPGSFAEVEVPLDEIPDAILIPPIALISGLKQQSVFVHRGGTVEQRAVSVGLRTADAVQIQDGLKPGDEVVVSGILQLRPGMNVRAKHLPSSQEQPAEPHPPASHATEAKQEPKR